MYKAIKYFIICLLLVAPAAFAQERTKEEMEQEKKFRESLDQLIEKYETDFKLEGWQVFYVDSILTHDFTALTEEIKAMGRSKVENPDLYQAVRDKWSEQMYNSLHHVFDEQQWSKYLKGGAAKEKKARDKRKEKREQSL